MWALKGCEMNLLPDKKCRTIVVLTLLLCSSLWPQSNLQSLLSQAHDLKDRGDLLSAAKLFKSIASESKDSTMIADALYGFVKCGDSAAILLTTRLQVINLFSKPNKDTTSRQKLLDDLDEQLNSLSKIGINLHLTGFEHDYYDNADTSIRPLLSKHFANTPAGELASFDIIDITCDRVTTIDRANSFLRRYFKSRHRIDVLLMLGRAYHDLWEDSNSPNMLGTLDQAEVQREGPDELRTQAIKYLSSAIKDKNHLTRLKWEPIYDKVLAQLQNGEHTGVCFYCCD